METKIQVKDNGGKSIAEGGAKYALLKYLN